MQSGDGTELLLAGVEGAEFEELPECVLAVGALRRVAARAPRADRLGGAQAGRWRRRHRAAAPGAVQPRAHPQPRQLFRAPVRLLQRQRLCVLSRACPALAAGSTAAEAVCPAAVCVALQRRRWRRLTRCAAAALAGEPRAEPRHAPVHHHLQRLPAALRGLEGAHRAGARVNACALPLRRACFTQRRLFGSRPTTCQCSR